MTLIFGTLTAIIIILQIFKHWSLYKGNLRTVYYLNIAVFIGYFITESTVAFNDPSQWPLIFMNVVNVFAIVMSLKGLMRLNEEEKNKPINSIAAPVKQNISENVANSNGDKSAPTKKKSNLAQDDWGHHVSVFSNNQPP